LRSDDPGSIAALIKNQGIGDLYRIYSIAEQDQIDFNLASIPSDFRDVSAEPFDQRYMKRAVRPPL